MLLFSPPPPFVVGWGSEEKAILTLLSICLASFLGHCHCPGFVAGGLLPGVLKAYFQVVYAQPGMGGVGDDDLGPVSLVGPKQNVEFGYSTFHPSDLTRQADELFDVRPDGELLLGSVTNRLILFIEYSRSELRQFLTSVMMRSILAMSLPFIITFLRMSASYLVSKSLRGAEMLLIRRAILFLA